MKFLCSSLAFLALLPHAFAAFWSDDVRLKHGRGLWAGLVTTINTNNGDITSLVFNGKQLQDSSKFTQLSSGLGSASVSSSVANNVAKITITTSTIVNGTPISLGVNTIYIGTSITAEPDVGELRLIARLSKSALPNGTAIEGSDVFLINGQTRSKFYSSVPFIRDQVHGGPFFRDINNQGSAQQELYWYMNSNHEQTETYRTGFFGPYALAITSGGAPSASLNTTFMDSLGLRGYVAASAVYNFCAGSYSGTLSGTAVTIGFKNSAAQYWVAASGSSINLSSSLSVPSVIWRIAGFLNADKIESMHPVLYISGCLDDSLFRSDTRMSKWGAASSFPMAQFKAVNNPTTIKWTASSSQIGARTLRIRTTEAFAGGRPQITVNSFTSSAPAAPPAVDSRGVTRGTWRGLNQVCKWFWCQSLVLFR
ncbi:putative rhamnogalacturonate lyase A [Favolaschia claudopus]|uniref:Rhamnogalacturonate lyase A n=1 Tax=Favolaschia claudopus TaxID=2862362 RepID=A0AAW0DAC3_9AGAR